jgi:hypothetical protein
LSNQVGSSRVHFGSNDYLTGVILAFMKAGRLGEFDALAARFFAAEAKVKSEIFSEATVLAQTVGVAAKHYLRVMEKVVNGSEEYIQKETSRCV